MKISTVALDRLAGSRKVVAVNLFLGFPAGSLLLIEDPSIGGKRCRPSTKNRKFTRPGAESVRPKEN